jgi:protein-disulfide isomerase
MSGKTARRRRQQAAAPPPVRSTRGARKANPKVIAGVAGLVALAVVVAVVAIVVIHKSGGNSGTNASGATPLPGAAATTGFFSGIPQRGNVLGSENAKATMIQYIDLQCPVCREFETTVMPGVVRQYVRTGKLKVVSRPIAFLGPDSEVARKAAMVALQRNHFSEFAQLLYANQGPENSGWVTDALVASAFASIPGIDVNGAMAARDSPAVANDERAFDSQAKADNVLGTPTVLVGKTGGKLQEVAPGGSPTPAEMKAAIDKALSQ